MDPQQVISMTNIIENHSRISNGVAIQWNNLDPKRKIMSSLIGLLPIRDNLDQRDINLHSVRCSVCDEGQETSHRVIIECNIAREVCFL